MSKDGTIYTTVGAVKGSDTIANAESCGFTDKYATGGYHYYRFEMIANDAQIDYSNVITVTIGCN